MGCIRCAWPLRRLGQPLAHEAALVLRQQADEDGVGGHLLVPGPSVQPCSGQVLDPAWGKSERGRKEGEQRGEGRSKGRGACG